MTRRIVRRKRPSSEEPTVNLTPLIDVVFCILIMFIVIAPLLDLDRVELADSNSQTKDGLVSIQEEGPLCIHVHQDNTIWLNKRLVDLPQLAALLKQEKQRDPTLRPQVFHDKRAQFGTYQSVKNAAEAAGFDQMDIILKPA